MPECYGRTLIGFLISILLMSEFTMSRPNHPVYFILMRDNDKAERRTKSGLKTKSEATSVLKGSLWTVDAKEFQDMSKKSAANLRSAESKEVSLTCELQDITKLNPLEFNLLLALTTCKERDLFHADNRHMVESTRLYKYWKDASDVGKELPRVEVRDDRLGGIVTGVLKYVGEVPERSGFWFGIEMDEEFSNLEFSNTDGSFEDQKLFVCAPKRGLLVTANKIFPTSVKNRASPHGTDTRLPLCDASINSGVSEPSRFFGIGTPLPPQVGNSTPRRTLEMGTLEIGESLQAAVEIGDRVVWYDENNVEQLATVRWVGILSDRLTIGVENDKPVGSGTGVYNNEQLFVTQPNHASLIPAIGLLKAEVVYGSKDLIPPCPKADAVYSNVTRAPAWEAAVTWETLVDRTSSVQRPPQPYLHSQSDSGTFRAAPDAQPLTTSASYDHISSSRGGGGGVHQGESVRSLRYENQRLNQNTLDLRNLPVYDVTDVSKNTHKPVIVDREESPRANDLTSKAEGHSKGSATNDTRHPHVYEGVGSATAPIAGAKPRSSPVQRIEAADAFVPRSLGPIDLKTDLDVGSMVEVDIPGYDLVQYGVIRWMGLLKEGNKAYVGVELEEENMACTDGTFKDVRLFACAPKKGFFTLLSRVRRDKRFAESSHFERRTESAAFGSMECNELSGAHPHCRFETLESLKHFLMTTTQVRRGSPQQRDFSGRNMGIQGHHNSCYLDATLFSMFAFSSAFDSVLHREKTPKDIKQYAEIQKVLRDCIVNPLRWQMFVRADKVLCLRNWLSECSSIQGLLDEEKDPDEFLISLLQQTLQAEPFIKLSSDQTGFCYQLFVDKDEKILLPTTQQLLSLSLFQADLKFVEAPRCLILQMPRFGKEFQMYKRIIPSLTLDVTNMLQHDPQPCCFCGKLASSECRDCFLEFGKGCDRAYFCKTCTNMSHSATMRNGHRPKEIKVYSESIEFYGRPNAPEIRSEILELFAVICIKTSHYVSFTKCGSNPDAPWVFFDSMADRIGQQYGHNVPQLEICEELPGFLKEENRYNIMKCMNDQDLSAHMRRLLCDGYVCLYQSPTLEPYR